MTPKEKATDIFFKFKSEHLSERLENTKFNIIIIEHVKKCALICVDEIIDSIGLPFADNHLEESEYWRNVKSEIEKL